MNGRDWGDAAYLNLYNINRFIQINSPGEQIVFTDEKDHRSSSNMGTFAQDPKYWNTNRWVDYIANFHERGDNFGFADGHAEYWKWIDDRTIDASTKLQFFYPDNGNPDLTRIRRSMFNGNPGFW